MSLDRARNGSAAQIDVAEGLRSGSVATRGQLSVEDLRVSYSGVRALDGVSVKVEPGGITGLIGPNGSGKTTFINVVSGNQKANAKRIELDGRDLAGLDASRRARAGISRTFQAIRLFGSLSVMDNAVLGATRQFHSSYLGAVIRSPKARREWREQREYAVEIFRLFGDRLLPRLNDPVSTLSYANRRRVEITRALMLRPSLLLLDEPMAGMNPYETGQLADLLPELMDSCGCSGLLVEHKMEVIVKLCRWTYVFDHGKCLAEGKPAEVQDRPDVVEAFLGTE